MPLWDTLKPQTGDALLIVDVQNDFLPGGSMPTTNGDVIVPVMNRYTALFQSATLPIFTTRCWHPADHRSFQAQGGPLPVHCIAWSEGAEFARRLKLPGIDEVVVISKGTDANKHASSSFDGTDLEAHLRKQEVRRLFVGGLTTERAVYDTVKDGLDRGFAVLLLEDATRPMNTDEAQRALVEMRRLGVSFVRYDRIVA